MERTAASRFRRLLLGWYRANGRDLPWRKTRDPYAVLISELMLQQQTVVRVVPVYERFLRAFPDAPALSAARRSDVLRVWSAIGLNAQAVRAHALARRVVAHGGELPRTAEGLTELPGVGRYTAAAVRCFAYGQRVALVDTNIRRVLGRVTQGSEHALSPQAAWQTAEALLPRTARDTYDWNQGLMDLGATVCRARGQRCGECPVRRVCAAAAQPVSALRETRAAYAARGPRRHEGSTRQLRGKVVRFLAGAPEGASLTAAEVARGVCGGLGVDRQQLDGALSALVKAGVLDERGGPRRVARYSLGEG